MGLGRRWARFLQRRRRERRIAEELAAHVAMRAEANRAAGMEADAAQRDAERRLGSDLAMRERVRAADGQVWLEDCLRDAASAGRMLRRRPGFTVLAIATLALGIGVTTAMFSVVQAVLLRPLPFPDAARLVQVDALMALRHERTVSAVREDAIAAVRASGIFAGVGVIGRPARGTLVYVNGFAASVQVVIASPELFPTLGVTPALGHGFTGHGSEAVVSHGFFQQELGGAAAALGKPLRVGERLYTLIGVLPAGQEYPPGVDVWLGGVPAPGSFALAIARLRAGEPPGIAGRRAEAAVSALGAHLPHRQRFSGLTLTPLTPKLAGAKVRLALWVLLAAAACLLLIACGNTANLLLARGLERQRELAVRRALGASRARLARLLLAEGLWLALLGGLTGMALAWALVGLARLGPASIPRLQAARLDPPVLAVAAAMALLCGLVCALAPALRLSRPGSARDALHGGNQVTRAQGLRRILVVGEVALTLVLLVGGVLLARTFVNMEDVTLGFNPQQVTTLRVQFPPWPHQTDQRMLQRIQQNQVLLAHLQALPGVVAAGYALNSPFVGFTNRDQVGLPGESGQDSGFWVREMAIGTGYFHTLGIRLLAGRSLTVSDLGILYPKPYPGLINAALARLLWPERDPRQAVGARLQWAQSGAIDVVGVVADVNDEPGTADPPTLYTAMGGVWPDTTVFLRSALPPAALAAEVRDALPSVAAGLSVTAPVALEDSMAEALAQPRFRALLLVLFAALAWALALVGLYGVLAFQVRQRRLEVGIRVAFGARDSDVLRLILGQSFAVLAAGIGAGWLLCWLLARYVSTLLFGVPALDPATWLGAGAVLLAAGLLASWIPAQSALAIDPAAALRCE